MSVIFEVETGISGGPDVYLSKLVGDGDDEEHECTMECVGHFPPGGSCVVLQASRKSGEAVERKRIYAGLDKDVLELVLSDLVHSLQFGFDWPKPTYLEVNGQRQYYGIRTGKWDVTKGMELLLNGMYLSGKGCLCSFHNMVLCGKCGELRFERRRWKVLRVESYER